MFSKPETPASVRTANEVFSFDGIPAKEFFIGGGYLIRYIPKENGILYIADDTTKRLLATISLHAEEKYEVLYDLNNEHMVNNLRALGIEPEKAAIKLYFVPKIAF
jgi:hypothetical protein